MNQKFQLLGNHSRLGYIGKEKDAESSLADHGVRKYDSETGRFTSCDALWEKYISSSPYLYCRNNPVSKIDNNGYYELNDSERKLCIQMPEKVLQLRHNVDYALSAVENKLKDGTFKDRIDGDGDAFRHALWSALNVRDFGYDIAKSFGNAHEAIPDNNKKSMNMDLINNENGYKLGLENKNASDEEMENIILQAVKDGSLQLEPTDKTVEEVFPLAKEPKIEYLLPNIPELKGNCSIK